MAKSNPVRKHPVIGCCGIDCGLCPRYYPDGSSRCPGCAAEGFFEKHPSCSIIICCVKKKNLETCADCAEFPCDRMEAWDRADSFVTHRKSLANLREIREKGLDAFLRQQRERINILEGFLEKYDEGRSKSFYCPAAALLPPEVLREVVVEVDGGLESPDDRTSTAGKLKTHLKQRAEEKGIDLMYRKG